MHPPQSPQIHPAQMRIQPTTPSTESSSPAGAQQPPHSTTPLSPPSRPSSTPKLTAQQQSSGSSNRTPEQHEQVNNPSSMPGTSCDYRFKLKYTSFCNTILGFPPCRNIFTA